MALNRHFPGHSVRFVHGFSAISRGGYRHARMLNGTALAWTADSRGSQIAKIFPERKEFTLIGRFGKGMNRVSGRPAIGA